MGKFSGIPRAPALALGAELNRLADHLDRQGRRDAAITLNAEQYADAHRLLHYQLLGGGALAWRGHPLRVAE